MQNNLLDLSLIKKLPSEIESIIKDYLPISVLLTLNKTYYLKYHKYMKPMISRGQHDNYVRDILRRDNDFVFALILEENFKTWTVMKKFCYSNVKYCNFFCFIDKFCIDNKSTKCRNVLTDFLNKKTGLSKNQHKKNTITNIIWTN